MILGSPDIPEKGHWLDLRIPCNWSEKEVLIIFIHRYYIATDRVERGGGGDRVPQPWSQRCQNTKWETRWRTLNEWGPVSLESELHAHPFRRETPHLLLPLNLNQLWRQLSVMDFLLVTRCIYKICWALLSESLPYCEEPRMAWRAPSYSIC